MIDLILHNKILLFLARNNIKFIYFLSLFLAIATKESFYIILFFLINISELSNKWYKFMAKKFMGGKTYKIIGRGKRPDGAKSKSYGMPSGHSQFAGAVSSYLALFNYYEKSKYYKIIIFSLIIAALYVMYSRVFEKWHTIQQTIIGVIIGVSQGSFAYVIYKKNLINKYIG